MRGRKHNVPRTNTIPHAPRANGGAAPEESGGKSEVFAAAKKGQNIGKIGGEKSKFRADRRNGGAAKYADGGAAHSDAAEDRSMIKRMVKGEALTGKKKSGGMCRADGGKVGADMNPHSSAGSSKAGADARPYSSAGRGLRHGGSCG